MQYLVHVVPVFIQICLSGCSELQKHGACFGWFLFVCLLLFVCFGGFFFLVVFFGGGGGGEVLCVCVCFLSI